MPIDKTEEILAAQREIVDHLRQAEVRNASAVTRADLEAVGSTVVREVSAMRAEMRQEIAAIREDVKGVQARVTVLETIKPSKPPPATQRALASYSKSDSGVFRLTDFELHDLHAEAETWRKIKSFAWKVAIPVAAALLLGLLAILAKPWGK